MEEQNGGSVPNGSSALVVNGINGTLNDSGSISTHAHVAGRPVREILLPELAMESKLKKNVRDNLCGGRAFWVL